MIYGRELPGMPYNLKAKATRCIIWGQRNFFRRVHPSAAVCPICHSLGLEEANRQIAKLIEDKTPCMVARFGSGELEATMRGVCIEERGNAIAKIFRMVRGESGPFWWDHSIIAGLCWIAGFFPPDTNELMKFSKLMQESSRQLDMLGSWTDGERKLQKMCFPQATICLLGELEPFFAVQPWTMALTGRKVLLIHPFVKTIEMQYARRTKIFSNPDMLPKFDLQTYRSISSLGGNETGFRTWFAALEKMKQDISKLDFDVAILGCGAYGFPLAAFIKHDLGRKAIHLGGVTQLLFGIWGGRWNGSVYEKKLRNEFWVRPNAEETIATAKTIEGGSYW